MYEDLYNSTQAIETESLKYSFRKTYDDQERYYLVLSNAVKDSRKNYNHIRDIVLPRITKFCFIKFKDIESNKIYIYMKPILFNSLDKELESDTGSNTVANEKEEVISTDKIKRREKQTKYRKDLLNHMPFCPFTHVSDDRLLQACHIKPYRVCDENEKYDYKNGIAMTPTYHVLFDLGFISFEDNGNLLISPYISNRTAENLNIRNGMSIRLQSGSEKYLKYHRENIFCNLPTITSDDLYVND